MKKLKLIFPAFLFLLALSSCNNDDDCVAVQQEDCFCIQIYDPVCGCNGVTYSNSCHAECDGIDSYTSGGCDE